MPQASHEYIRAITDGQGAPGAAGGDPTQMINRNLSRRLERLEERVMPETVHRVWQIV